MVFVILPFTGALGMDHLLLRSPITALLKFLSLVPLFGFWYFYDIAQLGEGSDLLRSNGIGIPFYGPVGIGANICIDPNAPTLTSAPEIARPWRFIGYVMTTLLFITFPVNKVILGDYAGAFAQMIMYFIFPLTFIALGWGFWDMYRILFDTRGLIEKGASRVPPVSWFMNGYFNPSALGFPIAPYNDATASWPERLVHAAAEVPIVALKTASTVVADTVESAGAVAVAATGTVEKAVEAAGSIADAASGAAGAVAATSEAASKTSSLLERLPEINKRVQAGGSSGLSTGLLIGVGVLALMGYVFKARSLMSVEKDDPPPKKSSL